MLVNIGYKKDCKILFKTVEIKRVDEYIKELEKSGFEVVGIFY